MTWGDADGRASAEAEDAPLRVDVRRGGPTDEELAAVVAVVSEAYAQEASSAVAEESATRSAWNVTARSLRSPLRRDLPWGRFSG